MEIDYQEYLTKLGVFDDIEYSESHAIQLFDEFKLPWKLNYTSETKDYFVITTSNEKTVMFSHNVNLLSFIVESANKWTYP